MSVVNPVVILCSVLLACGAVAQPPVPELKSGEATPEERARRAEDAAAFYTLLSGGYVDRRIEERVTVGVRDSGDRISVSDVTWRLHPGPPKERVLRMDMGQLRVYAQGTRLIAAHAQNQGTYYEAELAGGVTAQGLRSVLPPLPFPQASWGLGDGALGGVGQVLAEATWTDLRLADAGACNVRLVGEHSAGPIEVTAPRAALPWPPICTLTMPAAPGSPLRLQLMCERLPASDPATWVISTEGRTRVDSLAELKAVEPPVAVGQRVPVLGLMTADLVGWSLSEALESQNDGPLNELSGDRPVESFAVIILARTRVPGAAAAAEAARAVATDVRKDLDRRRHMGRTTLPRFFVRVAHVVDLEDISDPAGERAAVAGHPLPTSEPSTVPLFSAGGKGLIDSFIPGGTVVVAVIGPEERLAASIPVDLAGPFDAAAFATLLKEAVVGAHDVDLAAPSPTDKK